MSGRRTHHHRVCERRIRSYEGPVVSDPARQDARAHGGIVRIETCRCGAVRRVNRNGLFSEYGAWLPAEQARTAYDRAAERVDRSRALKPYRETILYDWPEGDAHFSWVATARVSDILDWARAISAVQQ